MEFTVYCYHRVVLSLSLPRLHAEFQLNQEPAFPFWFTPAQFSGRLVVQREAEHVVHFELSVPIDKQLNVGKGEGKE